MQMSGDRRSVRQVRVLTNFSEASPFGQKGEDLLLDSPGHALGSAHPAGWMRWRLGGHARRYRTGRDSEQGTTPRLLWTERAGISVLNAQAIVPKFDKIIQCGLWAIITGVAAAAVR
jgi:hypothetical protein